MIAMKKTPTNYTKQRLQYIFAVIASIFATIGIAARRRMVRETDLTFELEEADVLAMVQEGGGVIFKDVNLKGTARVTIVRNITDLQNEQAAEGYIDDPKAFTEDPNFHN